MAATVTDAKGAFVFLGVPPGHYIARVRSAPTVGSAPSDGSVLAPLADALHGEALVEVDDGPVPGLMINVALGARLRGRVEGPAGSGPGGGWQDVRIALVPMTGLPAQGRLEIPLDSTGHFESESLLPGRYRLDVSVPSDVQPEVALVDGRDVLDHSFELNSGRDSDAVVRLARSSGERLVCVVPSNQAQGADEPFVLVFPRQHDTWLANGMSPRRMRLGFASAGIFVATNLPSGEYIVVAGTGEVPEWRNPVEMVKLAQSGTIARVSGTGTSTVNVKGLVARR